MPQESYRTIIAQIAQIARTHSSQVGVFADFCRMSACALAAQTREEEYLEIAGRYQPEQLELFSKALALLVEEMHVTPFTDVLGEFYLEVASHTSKQARGEFFTPQEVSRLMARMLIDAEVIKSEGKAFTVNEPACGAGGMVLAVAELFAPDGVDLVRATCQDINPVAVDMCYINTTLWGIPARMVLGDTLRMTTSRCWTNLHWHRVGEDQRLQLQRVGELLREPDDCREDAVGDVERSDVISQTGASVEVQDGSHQLSQLGQYEFDLDLGSSREIER